MFVLKLSGLQIVINEFVNCRDRVLMFRNEVHQDRITLGIIENESVTPQSTLITVHR